MICFYPKLKYNILNLYINIKNESIINRYYDPRISSKSIKESKYIYNHEINSLENWKVNIRIKDSY
jgi:hypothetical protein